jgi:hypothetical protein
MAQKDAKSSKKQAKSSGSWLDNVRLQSIIVVLFAFALYVQTTNYGFVIDDKLVYSDNKFVKQGVEGIWKLMTTNSFEGNIDALEEKDNLSGGRYRPLSLVMFAIESQLFGHKAAPSHFVNIVMNALLVLGLFLLLRYLFEEHPTLSRYPAIPLLAALFFAAQPTHTEVVANIKSRDEILCLLLALASLYYFVRYARGGVMQDLGLSVLILFISLFAKETGLTFLFILPLSAYFFTNEFDKKRIIIGTVAVFAVIAVFLVIRTSIVGFLDNRASTSIFDNPFLRATVGEKYATAMMVLLRYLASAFYPWMMTYDYSFNTIPIVGWSHPLVILSVIVHAVLVAVAVLKLKEKHIISYGLWWFFATISIVSNIVFPLGGLMADRFLYAPSIGTSLIMAYGLAWLFALRFDDVRKQQWMYVYGASAVILLVYSVKTTSRNPDWHNEELLVQQDALHAPKGLRNRRIHSGFLLRKAMNTQDPVARKSFLDSAYYYAWYCVLQDSTADPKAWFNLGQYHSIFHNRYDSAVYHYGRARALDPKDPTSVVYHTFNIGNLNLLKGRPDSSVILYKSVMKYKVELETLHFNCGLAYGNMGMYDSAKAEFAAACRVNPNNQAAQQALAVYSQPKPVIDQAVADQRAQLAVQRRQMGLPEPTAPVVVTKQ